MKKTIAFTAIASVMVLAGVAEAQAGPRGDHGDRQRGARVLMMLGAADYDGNNTVTRAEVERLQREEFAFRDRNGDGFLDQADASPARQRLHAMRPDAGEAGERRSGRHGRRERIEQIDADGDGRISRAEFLGRELGVFERLDANGDDAISPDEIDAALEARQARRGEHRQARQWWRN